MAHAGIGYGTLDCFRTTADYTKYSVDGGATRLDLHERVSKIGVGAPLSGLGWLCPVAASDLYSQDLNYFSGATFSRPPVLHGVLPSLSLYSERRSEFDAYLRTTPVGGNVTLSYPRGSVTEAFAYSMEYGRTQAQPALLCAVFNACEAADQTLVQRLERLAVASFSIERNGSDNPVSPTRGSVLRLEFRTAGAYTGSDPSLHFNKVLADGSVYVPAGNGIVLAARVRLGAVLGSSFGFNNSAAFIPQQERLFGGGQSSVRGYQQNELGPAVYIPAAYDTVHRGRHFLSARYCACSRRHRVLPCEQQRRQPAHRSHGRQRARGGHVRGADPGDRFFLNILDVGTLFIDGGFGVGYRQARREHQLQFPEVDAGIRDALSHGLRRTAARSRLQSVPAAGRRRLLRRAGCFGGRVVLRESHEYAARDGVEVLSRSARRRGLPGDVPATAAERVVSAVHLRPHARRGAPNPVGRRRLVVLLSAITMMLIGGAVVGALVAATQSAGGREWIRVHVEQQITRGMKGRLYVGRLSGSFLTDLAVDSIAIVGPDDSVFIAAGPSHITYDPRDLLDGRIILRSVEIQHPFFVIRKENDNSWNYNKVFPPAAAAPGGTSVPRVAARRIVLPPSRSAFGAIVQFRNVRIRGLEFQLTLPWSPDDLPAAHGATVRSRISRRRTR